MIGREDPIMLDRVFPSPASKLTSNGGNTCDFHVTQYLGYSDATKVRFNVRPCM